jgi:uncharacterized membrane protein YsdA (DUF1294 family)
VRTVRRILFMSRLNYIILIYIVSINGIAYLSMCFDKYRSKKGGQRIAENTLFIMGLLCGAPGIYFGMKAPLYHKASKPKFKMGIPILILLNAVLICFLVA